VSGTLIRSDNVSSSSTSCVMHYARAPLPRELPSIENISYKYKCRRDDLSRILMDNYKGAIIILRTDLTQLLYTCLLQRLRVRSPRSTFVCMTCLIVFSSGSSIITVINFHTHTNYPAQIKYL
jgi:hypothetical protein